MERGFDLIFVAGIPLYQISAIVWQESEEIAPMRESDIYDTGVTDIRIEVALQICRSGLDLKFFAGTVRIEHK